MPLDFYQDGTIVVRKPFTDADRDFLTTLAELRAALFICAKSEGKWALNKFPESDRVERSGIVIFKRTKKGPRL